MTSRKVYCPKFKVMFNMRGEILQLATGLQEFHVKSCENEPKCTFLNHVECRVHKVLQAGKW